MVGVLVYVYLYSCLFIFVLVFVHLNLPNAVAACFQHEEWVFASTVTSNYSHVYLCVCMLYFVFVFHLSSGLRNDYGTTEVSLAGTLAPGASSGASRVWTPGGSNTESAVLFQISFSLLCICLYLWYGSLYLCPCICICVWTPGDSDTESKRCFFKSDFPPDRQHQYIINRAVHLRCIGEILMLINKARWCLTGVPILSTFSLSRFSPDKGESDPYH